MNKLRVKIVALAFFTAASLGGASAFAQEAPEEDGEELTYTKWCWYDHHPGTGEIAKFCRIEFSNEMVVTYWETDGTEPMQA